MTCLCPCTSSCRASCEPRSHQGELTSRVPSILSLARNTASRTGLPTTRLVTANIKDLVPLDAQYRAAGQSHADLILVSTKAFPQDRTYASAITSALVGLLDQPGQIQDSQVLFLTRY